MSFTSSAAGAAPLKIPSLPEAPAQQNVSPPPPVVKPQETLTTIKPIFKDPKGTAPVAAGVQSGDPNLSSAVASQVGTTALLEPNNPVETPATIEVVKDSLTSKEDLIRGILAYQSSRMAGAVISKKYSEEELQKKTPTALQNIMKDCRSVSKSLSQTAITNNLLRGGLLALETGAGMFKFDLSGLHSSCLRDPEFMAVWEEVVLENVGKASLTSTQRLGIILLMKMQQQYTANKLADQFGIPKAGALLAAASKGVPVSNVAPVVPAPTGGAGQASLGAPQVIQSPPEEEPQVLQLKIRDLHENNVPTS